MLDRGTRLVNLSEEDDVLPRKRLKFNLNNGIKSIGQRKWSNAKKLFTRWLPKARSNFLMGIKCAVHKRLLFLFYRVAWQWTGGK